MKYVSDMTKLDWHRCLELPCTEFFTYVAFVRYDNNLQKQMRDKIMGRKSY